MGKGAPRGWLRRRKILSFTLLGLFLVFVAATIPLIVFPARNVPRHVDAIVVLGGSGARIDKGLALARSGYASTLLLSVSQTKACPWNTPGVRVICFRPKPFTTQGEARYIAGAVKQYQWKHLIVVMSTDQTTRARLRIKRCTAVDVEYVSTGTALWRWPRSIAYEWAALGKALVLQTSC
jgi:uncharacterized SAM-binding protein YcdF (DUF218 family)